MLALNANRVTTLDQLIDAAWSANPPGTPRTQIHICISGLRKTLRNVGCTARITTVDPGYILDIDGDQLDRHVFDQLVESARTQEAAGRLEDAVRSLHAALALWRGPALADVPSDVTAAAARRLDERQVTAKTHRLRLEMALGRHTEIITDLRALVEEHPLREELYGNLMLALYRAGRQSEALETFQEARAVMVGEVGIEPPESLRSLERDILNRDKKLELPMAAAAVPPRSSNGGEVSSQLPAGIADFAGRDDQLTEICGLLSGDQNGAMNFLPIVGLSGRGGIGKSRLAVQAAHLLRDRFPDGQLYADLQLSHHRGQTETVLARFLRALGVPTDTIPDSQQEREELYRWKLTGKRVLVVLDDAVTEEQVRPLLPGVPGCGVILASRSRLSALAGARWIHLAELDPTRSLALLARQLGHERVAAEHDAAACLAHLCAGLPLALRIAAARLIARPHLRIADLVTMLVDENTRLDELSHGSLNVRSVIASDYERLAENGRLLFRRLGVIETAEFPWWTAAALLDVSPRAGLALTETLVESGILDVVSHSGDGTVRYRFHDLFRIYAREQLAARESEAERDALVRRWLGGWLSRTEQAHRTEFGEGYMTAPSHVARWNPPGGWIGLGTDSPTWIDGESDLLVSAVGHAGAANLYELCWNLALIAVALFEAKGRYDDWRDTATTALDIARRAGNARGEGTMLYSLGVLALSQDRLSDADDLLNAALVLFERHGETRSKGLTLRNLALLDRARGDLSGMHDKYRTALTAIRAAGDRIGEAHVLINLARSLDPAANAEARTLLDEALAFSRETGCHRGEAQALCSLGEAYLRLGEPDQAIFALNQALPILEQLRDNAGQTHARYVLGLTHGRQGQLDQAVSNLAHSLELARQIGDRRSEGLAFYRMAEIHAAHGDRTVAVKHCVTALRVFDELGLASWHTRAARLAHRIGSGGAGECTEDERGQLDEELRVSLRADNVLDHCLA